MVLYSQTSPERAAGRGERERGAASRNYAGSVLSFQQLLIDRLDLGDAVLELVGHLAQLLHGAHILNEYSVLTVKKINNRLL